MKLFVFALLALVAFAAADEKYTTKYDDIDLDEILNSPRLFDNYYKCLLETGKCTPDGRELKTVLPDALQGDCSKCNPKQRDAAKKVANFVIENKPEEWKILSAKYDPDGVYTAKYTAEVQAAKAASG